MKFGVCAPLAKIKIVPPGLDYIETSVDDLLCPRQNEQAFAKRLEAAKACPLPVEACNMLLPGDLKSTGMQVSVPALDAYIAIVCQRAAQAGVGMLVFGSGGSRRVPEGFDLRRAQTQLVNHLRRWNLVAAKHAVTVVIEPLNRAECNIINGVDEGAEIVRQEQSTHIRLLVDTYHMAKENESPDVIKRARGLIAHAHCAEGNGRGPLGTKGESHRPYFRALKDIGYDARMSIEARWDDFDQQLPAAVVELRNQWQSA